jgi:ABC-type sulfate transport system permease component
LKKSYIIAVCSIIVFLVIFIPIASTNPDGLEQVVSSLGAHESDSFWSGILPDYSVSGVRNSYLSSLIAGIIGVVLVLLVGLVLTKGLKPKTLCSNASAIKDKD